MWCGVALVTATELPAMTLLSFPGRCATEVPSCGCLAVSSIFRPLSSFA